eukprot:6471240-Amphidinium_carterae.2
MLRKVISLRAGPFKSHAHQGLLRQCLAQLRASNGHAQPLWEHFYPDIYAEQHGSTEDTAYGTSDSIVATFADTLGRLESQGPGGARLTRWFNFEQKSEELSNTGLAALHYLLTYAMVSKGQWKKWADTPMGQAGMAVATSGTEEGPVPDADACAADAVDALEGAGKAEEQAGQSLRLSGSVNKSISVAVAILCQSLVTRMGKGLASMSRPLRLCFGDLLAQLKSPRGAAQQLFFE